MYNFTPILSTSTIGDSLPFVNANYEQLDLWTHNIQASATYLWQPLVDLYNSNFLEWENSITLLQNNSAAWISVSSTVENLSATWLKPLCIFYPDLYPVNTDLATIKNTITLWVNQNFPILPVYSTKSHYIEGQELIVYNYNYYTAKVIKNSEILIDQTTCYTADGAVSVSCKNSYSGYIYCSNGDFDCTDKSVLCDKNQTVYCNFPSDGPYILSQGYSQVLTRLTPIKKVDEDGNITYIPREPVITTRWDTNDKAALSYIRANISTNFTDRAESVSLNQFRFVVRDCQWVYTN